MIDRHYGHLARDGRKNAIALLDALAADPDGRLVDAATDNRNRAEVMHTSPVRHCRNDVVDVSWTSRRQSVVPLANKGAVMQEL